MMAPSSRLHNSPVAQQIRVSDSGTQGQRAKALSRSVKYSVSNCRSGRPLRRFGNAQGRLIIILD